MILLLFFFFFSSRRRHTRSLCDWSSDVCSSDLAAVDLPHLALEPVRRELEAVGAEGVGLDQVGPRRDVLGVDRRSEERRVGKECRCRWWPEHEKKKNGR